MLPEPLYNLSPMNPGIVILEFAGAIREGKKNPLMEEHGHSVYSGCQLTSLST